MQLLTTQKRARKQRLGYDDLRQEHDGARLVDMFVHELMSNPHGFHGELPVHSNHRVSAVFSIEHPTAAVVSLHGHGDDVLTGTGVVASGVDEVADRAALGEAQALADRNDSAPRGRPLFDLLALEDRPLVASLLSHDAEYVEEANLYSALIAAFGAAFLRMRGVT